MKEEATTGQLVLLFVLIIMIGQSCISHRNLITFDPIEDFEEGMIIDTFFPTPGSVRYQAYKLRPHDQLMVRINAFSGDTEDFIRSGIEGEMSTNRLDYDPSTVYFNSFTISDSGYIVLPYIDKVKVVGLTVLEVQEILDEAYKPYLKLASTRVKFANNRVTVLGEVSKPGVYYIYNEVNTLLDAIGLAGDFTEFANRRKVRLMRQTENGTSSIFLDLTRSDFISTEYFFLRPNDLLYIEPARAKSFDSSARSVGIVLSTISIATLIINLFARSNN